MSGQQFTIAEGHTIDDFLVALCRDREVFALKAGEEGNYHLTRGEAWDGEGMTLGGYRQVEPLKSIFFPPREFFGRLLDDADHPTISERIVIGVKNCDLAGLKIQDHVFRDLSPSDPRYVEARDKTLIVTCDCTDCREACFCPIVGQKPYAEEGYDLNISPVSQQHLIEAGSERGHQFLDELSAYLRPASDSLLESQRECREALIRRLLNQSAQHGLEPGMDFATAVRGAKDGAMWSEIAQDCVECGACNFACCTCHCFQLVDGVSAGVPVRGKQWDGCLLMNFARVAGGGNPRAGRAKRLQNRFLKKFDFFPSVLGCYACDGCGRCTEVCTGNIDIRDVLSRAVDETKSVPADRGDD